MKTSLALGLLCLSGISCGGGGDGTLTGSAPPFDAGRGQSGSTGSSSPSAATSDAARGPGSVSSGSSDDCSDAAKLVYVVDQNGQLASFRPDKLQFLDIGALGCDKSSNPFSMSVDRQGSAWIIYGSGRLYRASTSDASCTATSRPGGAGGFSQFGMGFVASAAKPAQDTLFIAGSGGDPLDVLLGTQTRLGVIDTSTLSTTSIGPLDGSSPELTGTGDGKLWAFYAVSSPPQLQRLDPKTATTLESHVLEAIDSAGASAWAMAFWGGDFWLFLQSVGASSTTVYRVDGTTFEQTVAIKDTGRSIVGAGVSTCAPLVQLL
ncbi:MAG: hypothetical protein JWN04_4566 [Myxococcaceae bacterium]|nr:hypothetical protein [Myxococcaceae bacterium]